MQPVPSKAASKDTDIDAERAQLEDADRQTQLLLEQSLDKVADADSNLLGHLHVPVYGWDDPLKLLERAVFTPDKQLH